MKYMGHRGARHEAPENTLLSIETALKAGVDGIEIDVHLSRGGKLVVIHDDTLERTTNGTGAVAERPLAELRELDAGEGEKIPTLEEVLEAVRGRAELFIEIKAADCEAAVVKTVSALGMREACLVKAFNHRHVVKVKELEPSLRTGCLLYGLPVDPVGLVRAAKADFISLNTGMLDKELVEQCHQAGIEVCAWNCNRAEEVPHFRALGVDWLGTDAPSTVVVG